MPCMEEELSLRTRWKPRE